MSDYSGESCYHQRRCCVWMFTLYTVYTHKPFFPLHFQEELRNSSQGIVHTVTLELPRIFNVLNFVKQSPNL
jgi:hypothetical protein